MGALFDKSDKRFVLVTGSMRSGTTLLGELLYSRYLSAHRHPSLAFANDNVTTLRELSAALREAVVPPVPQSDPFQEIPLQEEVAGRFLTAHGASVTSATRLGDHLCDEIARVAPTPSPATMHGVKLTGLYMEMAILRRCFRAARQLLLFRDPRDVLASNIRRHELKKGKPGLLKKAFQKKDFTPHLVLVMTLNEFVYWEASAAAADVMAVQYEDLVRNTRPVMEKVLKFLDLDPAAYLWDSLSKEGVVSNSSFRNEDPNGVARDSGVTTDSVGRFKDQLTTEDVFFTEKLMAPLMARFNYTPSVEPTAKLEKAYRDFFLPSLRECALRFRYYVGSLGLGEHPARVPVSS